MRSLLRCCVILVLVAACRRAPREPEAPPSPAVPVAPAAEAARNPATAAGTAPAPGAAAARPALAPALLDRQAGGRPISWWKDYLAKLRLGGPRPLFELAVARARANGLVVNVTEAAVTVDAPAQQKAAAP